VTDPRVPAGLQANVPQAGLAEDTARADAHAVPAGLEANVPQAGLPSDPPRRPLEIEQTLPDPSAEPGQLPRDYMHDQPGIRSWLLTHDHKRIAIMFLVVVTLSLMLGGTFAGCCAPSCSRRDRASSSRSPTTGCSRCTAW
jgi:hypothetical protein